MFENSAFVQVLCNWREAQKYHFFHKDETDKNVKMRQLHKSNCHCINAERNASIYTNPYAALSKKMGFL